MPIKKMSSDADLTSAWTDDGAGAADTTAVDTTAAPHGLLAWEADDDDEVDLPHVRRTWEDALSAAGLIVAACAAVAVVVYVVHTMGSHHDAAVPARAVITTVRPTPAPAPVVVTTVTVTPPAPTSKTMDAAPPVTVTETPTTTYTAAQDQEFLRLVTQPASPWFGADPADLIQMGHWACTTLAGPSHPHGFQVADRLAADRNIPTRTAEWLVSSASAVYCIQYG
jgi:hypothetical protein